jgi:hypothetical protein
LDVHPADGLDTMDDSGAQQDDAVDVADGSGRMDGGGADVPAGDAAGDGDADDLTGDGVSDGGGACPTAVARGRVQGSGDPWTTELEGDPLETIELDGNNSFGETPIVAYDWAVTDRPAGSVSAFEPSPSVATPTFVLDLAGLYVFRLDVVDEVGVVSCQPAEVTVTSPRCCDGFHLQLVWDGGDGGSADLDLHLLHPLGSWDESPYDCFSSNPNPNWGDASTSADDPSLDTDSTAGATPENINLDQPEGAEEAPFVYQVGVFHQGGDASDATVRIFIEGRERFAATFPGLEEGQFWDVARIEWPSGEITRIHRLYRSGFPGE